MDNRYYHEFTPGKLDPALIFYLVIGLVALVVLAYFVVRIRPIDDRCRRYHSVGSKAARVVNPHRRSGSPSRGETGLAIILPSTSFDWGLATSYAVYAVTLVHHYHGAGILQLLYNRGFSEFAFVLLMMLGGAFTTPFVVFTVRLAEFVSAKKQFLATVSNTGSTIHVYEEWGLYDKLCRKEFNAILKALSRKEKRAVRAVVSDSGISEKTKLDRAQSFVLAQSRLKRKTKPVEFESILDSFVEFVYQK